MRLRPPYLLILLGCALLPAGAGAAANSSSPLGDLVGAGAGLDGAEETQPATNTMSRPVLALPRAASAADAVGTFPALHVMSLANSQIRSIPIYRYPDERARVQEEIERINLPGAMAILREIIENDPNYAPAHAVLAVISERYQPGNEDSAVLLETARSLAPDNEVVRAALLEFAMLRGETRRCIEESLKFVAEVEAADQPVPVWPYELVANAAVREEDAAAVLEASDKLLELDPDNLVAILSLASYARFTNHYDPVIARYEAVDRLSRDPIARNNLAYLYSTTGRQRQALTILEQLAAQYPESVAVRDSLALVYYRLGDHDKALAMLDAIIADAPRFAPALLHRALVLADQGKMEEAGEELRRAILFDTGSLEEAEVREARRKIP